MPLRAVAVCRRCVAAPTALAAAAAADTAATAAVAELATQACAATAAAAAAAAANIGVTAALGKQRRAGVRRAAVVGAGAC